MLRKVSERRVDLFQPRSPVYFDDDESMRAVLKRLNAQLHIAGISKYLGWSVSWDLNADEPFPTGYRLICWAMRGRSEMYWVDLIAMERSADRPVVVRLSSVKCESWEDAVELSTLTAQLLDITD